MSEQVRDKLLGLPIETTAYEGEGISMRLSSKDVDKILTAIEEGIERCGQCNGRGWYQPIANREGVRCGICGGKGWVMK